jgi:hypothetical protein
MQTSGGLLAMRDESPKNGHAVYAYGTSATCVEDGKRQNVALGYIIVPNGLAETEGQRITDDLKVEFNGGKQVSMIKCGGGISDNAPTATAATAHAIKLDVASMKASSREWEEMSPAQQRVTVDMQVMRCANHKVCEASVKNEERDDGRTRPGHRSAGAR